MNDDISLKKATILNISILQLAAFLLSFISITHVYSSMAFEMSEKRN